MNIKSVLLLINVTCMLKIRKNQINNSIDLPRRGGFAPADHKLLIDQILKKLFIRK